MHTPRLRHGNRRRAQIAQEQATQMPRTDTEPLGQIVYAAVIERAFSNQLQSARNAGGSSQPGRRSRRRFGPAAQTRAKSGFGGRSRGWIIANVFRFRRGRGADRPAVNPGGGYADAEPSVEPRVPGQARPITSSGIHLQPLWRGGELT